MKYVLLIAFFFFSCAGLRAQVKVHKDMRTPTWNLIGLRYDKQVEHLKWVSIFPPELMALNNKVIELPGYIYPTKVGAKFSEFMLSIVPIESCPFCGSGDIPSMIEVKMVSAIPFTDRPIKIKGKFVINNSGDDRSEFFLLGAKQIP
ncbi:MULTISPECIES: hypothetical protein [unclassified Pedobacter]|uniref:hypothetical protein n=1 Tax=Pedobacter TaxID=84567 RepID=UPI000B4C0672|nr:MULTISPECIES: hypothetical protein [unclassified Pedobacter]MCX2585751.1 hypothetical protein [Pedobacter sp. MR22-3]OWK70266.1 hypothetical protein CBW18_12440 [Pedobacter sp. AJM]